MEKYNLTAFSKGAELRVSWYPTERPQGMATVDENTLLISTIIDVDEFYYKQVATIEHQIDINYPII